MAWTRRGATVVLVGVFCAALLGCGARTKTVEMTPADKANLRSFHTVAVQVDAEAPEDLSKELATLGLEVVQRIKVRRLYEEVRMANATENASGVLLLKATILKAKKVGTGKRFMLGAFAGRAGLTVDVRLVEAASGRQVGAYTVTGQSGGSGLSGGTDDAVTKAAEGIAGLLG